MGSQGIRADTSRLSLSLSFFFALAVGGRSKAGKIFFSEEALLRRLSTNCSTSNTSDVETKGDGGWGSKYSFQCRWMVSLTDLQSLSLLLDLHTSFLTFSPLSLSKRKKKGGAG